MGNLLLTTMDSRTNTLFWHQTPTHYARLHQTISAVCSDADFLGWQQTWAALAHTSLNPTWYPWWKRVHLVLSAWVNAGCASSTLSFLSTTFTILKPMARRDYSVISPVLSGPCRELGAIWSGRKAPMSCRVVWALPKGWGWQRLEYRCTGLSWLQALPGMLCFHVISASDSRWVSVPSIFPVQIFISPSRDSKCVALLISAYKQWVWAGDSQASALMCIARGTDWHPIYISLLYSWERIRWNFEDNKYSKVDLCVLESSHFYYYDGYSWLATRLHLELIKT